MLFDNAVEFFDDDNAVNLRGKIADFLNRKRIDKPSFKTLTLSAKDFLNVLVAGTGAEDTELCAAHFHPVERA